MSALGRVLSVHQFVYEHSGGHDIAANARAAALGSEWGP